MKSGNLNFLEPSGPLLQACNGTALPLQSWRRASKENGLLPIFLLFLTWLFCKLRFLTHVDSSPPHVITQVTPIFKIHFNIILTFVPVLMWSPIFRCTNQNLHAYLTSLLCTAHTACHILIPFVDHNNMWWTVKIMKHLTMQFSVASFYSLPLRSKYSDQHPILRHP